jgi:3D (Asp-Asp-Asp) domain-containing protein
MLAEVPHIIPIEEIAQPVWRLPRGIRAAAIIFGLTGLVCGVRVLDAQIASRPAESGQSVRIQAAGISSDIVDATAPAARTTPPPASPTNNPQTSSVTGGSRPRTDAPNGLILQQVPAGDTHHFINVTVTAYNAGSETASSRHVRPGTVALSRDLLRNFTPDAPFRFGDRVLIPGMGMYVVEDAMAPKWKLKADIWFSDAETARRWGVRSVYVTRLSAGEPLLVAPDWNQ